MFSVEALNVLKKKGYKITKPRAWIIDYLNEEKSHPSAMEIFENIRSRKKDLSFATIYNTLDILTKENIIRQIKVEPHCSRYESDIDAHGHFYCRRCKTVFNIYGLCSDIKNQVEIGKIEDYDIIVYGLCKKCAVGDH